MSTPPFKRSQWLRLRIERLFTGVDLRFACIKHNDGLVRIRLRGRRGAGEQLALAATARNLKLMNKLLNTPAPVPVGA